MQLLSFTVAGEPYAIESRRVVEVLPLVPARAIPRTPDYVAAERAETSLPPLELETAPFLGRLLRIDGRTLQVIDVDRLLPADLAAGLFPAPASEAAP